MSKDLLATNKSPSAPPLDIAKIKAALDCVRIERVEYEMSRTEMIAYGDEPDRGLPTNSAINLKMSVLRDLPEARAIAGNPLEVIGRLIEVLEICQAGNRQLSATIWRVSNLRDCLGGSPTYSDAVDSSVARYVEVQIRSALAEALGSD